MLQSQTDTEWFKQFEDFDASKLQQNMFVDDLKNRIAFLRQLSVVELIRVALYFDSCCPNEWQLFINSLDNEKKKKLSQEKILRRDFQSQTFEVILKLNKKHSEPSDIASSMNLIVNKHKIYLKFCQDEGMPIAGADDMLPFFIIAIQASIHNKDKEKVKTPPSKDAILDNLTGENSYYAITLRIATDAFTLTNCCGLKNDNLFTAVPDEACEPLESRPPEFIFRELFSEESNKNADSNGFSAGTADLFKKSSWLTGSASLNFSIAAGLVAVSFLFDATLIGIPAGLLLKGAAIICAGIGIACAAALLLTKEQNSSSTPLYTNIKNTYTTTENSKALEA